MLKTSEGAGRRARPLTSDTAEHPLPRSRRSLLVDPVLLPDDADPDACLGVVAGDDGMLTDGIRKGDLLVVEEVEWVDVPNGARGGALHDRVVARRFELANAAHPLPRLQPHVSRQTARPDEPRYFVLGASGDDASAG